MRNNVVMCVSLVALMLTLTACSLLSPVNTNSNIYLLNKLPTQIPQHAHKSTTILVSTPDTLPVFNTTQMAYTKTLYRVDYFSQHQWVETPSQMLSPLIIQTLQNTHGFRAVLTPVAAGHYDYILSTQITQLQQNFIYQRAIVQFSLRAQLVNASTNRIVASSQFSADEPIGNITPYNGVMAANRAVARVLAQLAVFCNKNIR